jgi:hypothetical protein
VTARRSLAAVLVLAIGWLAAGPATARGRQRLAFRVELRTGTVTPIPDRDGALVPILPPPRGDSRRAATHRDRTVILLEGDPAVPGERKIIWELPGGTQPNGFMPWSVVQDDTLVFAWREERRRGEYRELTRAYSIATRKLLWQRDDPYHDAPGAGALGPDHFVLDQDQEVLLLETRTGRVLRRLAKSEDFFAVSRPEDGKVWVEAGAVIECLDEKSARTLWKLPKMGKLISLDGLGGDWLVKTATHAYRIHGDGAVVWSAPSDARSRPVIRGDRSFEGSLDGSRATKDVRILLRARDLGTGKVVREYLVASYPRFFDEGLVAALAARDGSVDVGAQFTVLD